MASVQFGQHAPAARVILHLSDTHLLAGNRLLGERYDTAQHLRRTLQAAEATGVRPDAVVFTGDLTDLGEPEAYRALRAEVEPWAARLGAPVVWVAGNHDERPALRVELLDAEATGADAVSLAARQIAETLQVAAIVTYTATGTTGLRTARERPQIPILALSPIRETTRRLSLAWGLQCVHTEDAHDLEEMVDKACRLAVQNGFARAGERIIITAGVPLRTPGATNMIRIAYIGSDGLSAV